MIRAALPVPGSGVSAVALRARILASARLPYQGYAESTVDLGLPVLPGLQSVTRLFDSTTSQYVWYLSPAHWRADGLTAAGENDVYQVCRVTYQWNYSHNLLTRIPGPPPARQLIGRFLRALPIVAVLALATFARLWQLREFPFGDWIDEAFNGLAAAQILNDPSFRPVYIDTTQMPSHFNYLVAFSFSFFGVNPLGVRIVTAAFGIAGVLFAYLLFRRWFGNTIGVVAACGVAVMRYDLTFSRFGMHGIATPMFELAALYFLDRALAERKLHDFAWLGLTIGFGLAFGPAWDWGGPYAYYGAPYYSGPNCGWVRQRWPHRWRRGRPDHGGTGSCPSRCSSP